MIKSLKSFKNTYLYWLKVFCIIILIIGLFFRFLNIEKKVYWGDEISALLRVSGDTTEQVRQALKGRIVGVEEILKYQQPDTAANLLTTIEVSEFNATHPPLYFLMARLGMQWFKDFMISARSVSVLISLLAFPCIYWLCRELFQSSLVGWITIALVAVSPFDVLYAQEARMYSLLKVDVLLSSAALLRSIRINTKASWGIYAATIGLGLNTHLFFSFVAIGHGIYVAIIERFRLSKLSIAYLLASCLGFLIFLPWFWVIINNHVKFQQATEWADESTSFLSLIKYFIYNNSYVFIDFFYVFTDFSESQFNWGFGIFLVPLLTILVIYSIYYLICNTPMRVWLFIIILIFSTAIAIILPDLIWGGYRSIMSRYFTASYVGIQLATAYLLTRKITAIAAGKWQQQVWRIITVLLISGGILSCLISSQAETWWNKRIKYTDLQITKTINLDDQPLLMTPSASLALILSHHLDPKVKMLIFDRLNIPRIPDNFSHLFLIPPSPAVQNELKNKQNYEIERVYQGRRVILVKLKKNILKNGSPDNMR